MLLLNPKPLCVPWTTYIYRARLSPASTSGSGLRRAVGTCCLPCSGDVPGSRGSVCPPTAPTSRAQGGRRGVGPPPPPLPATKGVTGREVPLFPQPLGVPRPFGSGQGQQMWGQAHLAWSRRQGAEPGVRPHAEPGTRSPGGNWAFLSHTPATPAWAGKGAGGCPGLPQGWTGTLPSSSSQIPAAYSACAAGTAEHGADVAVQGCARAILGQREAVASGQSWPLQSSMAGALHSAGAAGLVSSAWAVAAEREHLPAAGWR